MNRKFREGDKVKFIESAASEVRGKIGIVNEFLGVERISLSALEHGKSVNRGLYKDVNMWKVKLSGLNKVYPAPEDWLDSSP
jgi:hypothetical protein